MESFARYLLSLSGFKDRLFISDSPGPVVLIWSNVSALPNVSGISVVESANHQIQTGLSGRAIAELLRNQLQGAIHVSEIKYENEMNFLEVDGERLGLAAAAEKICADFGIRVGDTPAKRPNNAAQINDPFHIWSRGAFDGATVFKADLDIITVRDNRISSLIEIKRSAKSPVGSWQPFVNPHSQNNDINNYLMMLSLSNLLNCRTYTIHHDEMDGAVMFNGDEVIDIFEYVQQPNQQPNQATLEVYASTKNRRTESINCFLKV